MADPAATFCATLVDEWVRAGVTESIIAPGSRSTPLALALVADRRVRAHVHHDERCAAFMALGVGLGSGQPAIVLTTSGTATAHLHAAVIEADLSGVPMLVCTADRPPELQGRGAPQTIAQTELYGGAVRWFHAPGPPEDGSPEHWRPLAAEAYQRARRPRPGPVHLNLAFREPLTGRPGVLPDGRPDRRPWLDDEPATPGETADLPDAPHGIVVAGRSTASPDLVRAVARVRGWPVVADPRSGLRDDHDSTVVHADAFLRDGEVAGQLRPDVVLRIGEPPASRILNEWIADSAAHEIVVADRFLDPLTSADDVVVTVDVDATIRPWAEGRPRIEPAWTRRWRAVDDASADAIDAVLESEGPLTEPAALRAAFRATPGHGALVVSSSMPVRDLEWYGERRSGATVVANRGANGIDGVLSTAIGVALTGRPVVVVVGDVAFLHDSNALIGLADRPVSLSCVVIDNDGGGIFSFLPQARELDPSTYEQLFGTPHGVDPLALAAVHGLDTATAETDAQLIDLAAPGRGARVVRVRSDRSRNADVHAAINAAVAAAARRALVAR